MGYTRSPPFRFAVAQEVAVTEYVQGTLERKRGRFGYRLASRGPRAAAGTPA